MIVIEFLKIIKRKFNYIYLFLLFIFSFLGLYFEDIIVSYLSVIKEKYIYYYLIKIILINIIFLLIINIVFSYREDYKCKVINIIKYSKIKITYNIFSKLISNILVFTFIFIIFFVYIVIYNNHINRFDIITFFNYMNFVYLLSSFVLLIFFAILSLLIVSIFNNTNLSLSIIFLIFFGSKFIINYLSNVNELFFYLKFTFFDIFPNILRNIGLENYYDFYKYSLILLIFNTFVIFILLLLVNRIKFNTIIWVVILIKFKLYNI